MKKALFTIASFFLIILLSTILNKITFLFITKSNHWLNLIALVIIPIIGIKVKNEYIKNASYLVFLLALIFLILFYALPFWGK